MKTVSIIWAKSLYFTLISKLLKTVSKLYRKEKIGKGEQ